MQYLLAIFLPPLYWLTKKKWLAFCITSFLFLLSIIFCIMVVLIPGAFVLWFLCAMVAVWDARKSLMHEHATIMAEKMASKMAETMRQQQPPAPPRS